MFPVQQSSQCLILVAGCFAAVALTIVLAIGHAVNILFDQIFSHRNKALNKENIVLAGSHSFCNVAPDRRCLIIIHCKRTYYFQAIRFGNTLQIIHLGGEIACTGSLQNEPVPDRSRQLDGRGQLCIYKQFLRAQVFLNIFFDLLDLSSVASTIGYRILGHATAHRASKQNAVVYQLLCNTAALALRPISTSKGKVNVLLVRTKEFHVRNTQRDCFQQKNRLENTALIWCQAIASYEVITIQNNSNVRA